jgi:hypothetical protein
LAIKAGGGALGGSGIPRIGKWGSGGSAGGGFGSGGYQGEQGSPFARPVDPSAGSWGANGAATFALCIKEVIADEDTTFINCATALGFLSANVTLTEFGALASIPSTKFQVQVRVKKSALGAWVNGVTVSVFHGKANALGALITSFVIPQANITAAYQDFTYTLTAPEGTDFKTDVNHSLGFTAEGDGTNVYRVTQGFIRRLA